MTVQISYDHAVKIGIKIGKSDRADNFLLELCGRHIDLYNVELCVVYTKKGRIPGVSGSRPWNQEAQKLNA